MTPAPDEYLAELARLEEQPAKIAAAVAEAQTGLQQLAGEQQAVQEALGRARYSWAIEGPSPERSAAIREEELRLGALRVQEASLRARLDATAQARRDNAAAVQRLLKEGMASTFRPRAERLAAEAAAEFRALAAEFRGAYRKWQAAAAEWQRLAGPLAELLRERDAAAGVYRDPSYYAAAVRVPPFPFPPAGLVAACEPQAVELLDEPARPKQQPTMKRVA